MKKNPEATILLKAREMMKLLNINLNHFPRHERHGLSLEIRRAMYGVYGLLVEGEKRYHKKTTLTNLDILHEQLRAFINLAFDMGYFNYHHHKRGRSSAEEVRRYTAVSILVDELGRMIGGWINSLRDKP